MSAPRRSTRLAAKNPPVVPAAPKKAPCPYQAEITLAEQAASKLFPTYSPEWYNELEKCEAYQNRRAAFWNSLPFSISAGW